MTALELKPLEARVLGVLIEKERTTPEGYPLSLNAVIAGCNQKSNRDPVMNVVEREVNEAILTGETFPAEKRPGPVDAGAPLAARTNSVFMGTNVRAGPARVLVVATGASTSYGGIEGRLRLRPPETEFDRLVLQFGFFLPI